MSDAGFTERADAAFRAFVFDDAFSCLGAKAALRRATYRLGSYARLADPDESCRLARALAAFAAERRFGGAFSTYVAVFREGVPGGEAGFERALWSQLQLLHEHDARDWDPRVSSDPEDPRFSFSVGGSAFFVVGLHPHSSRSARRFAWPALAFNPHEQFERLRGDGRYARLRDRIRDREQRLDGLLNPNVAEFGSRSEARQYSGRAVEASWRCPFRPRR